MRKKNLFYGIVYSCKKKNFGRLNNQLLDLYFL